MNLPNYFLADLGPDAGLTPGIISEACQTLRRNREQYLRTRTTGGIIRLLCDVAENWLQPDYPLRRRALAEAPEALGFSAPTLARGLDACFRQFTPEQFHAMLIQELGHAGRLDGFSSTSEEDRQRRSSMAHGPDLLVHIAAGNIPVPALMCLATGLLIRSAQFLKCATGTALLPRLFAHSLYEADAKIGACIEIAEWKGGSAALEEALFAEANCVTATGSDEVLAKIAGRLPRSTRFLGYGHRLSFGYIAAEALRGAGAKKVAIRAAADVAAWNQLGCLSPHVIYVEQGTVPPEHFAEMLAQELDAIELVEPRGPLSPEESADIASRRSFYEVRAAHSPETMHWSSHGSTAWTVIFETDPLFQTSCLNRFLYVKLAPSLGEVLHKAELVRGKVSTVGLAAPPERARELATEFARWGVPRICQLGEMQCPPLSWRHDGRPALADLVTWTDWEG